MKKNIDLLHEPILPALTRLALPIMATSLVQMAYNMTVPGPGRPGRGGKIRPGGAAAGDPVCSDLWDPVSGVPEAAHRIF